jgi:ribosome maturation factor RimP
MGLWAHFLLEYMHKAPQAIETLVRGVVEPMGYELVGVELVAGGRGGEVLRVYIDREGGIMLDDCTAVSHQLSGVLDVEDPIKGEYALEVSSPGMARPLFELAHFARFTGHQVKLKLGRPLDGRRNFKGLLTGVEGNEVLLQVDGEPVRIDFNQIDSAKLVPEF